MKRFQGTITAIITPFLEDGSVDVAALKKLVEFQIKGGVSGVVPCGTTGEAATLSDEEKRQVYKTVIETAKKRVLVIAGCGSNDTKKAVALSKMAKDEGADALLHVTPFYNKPTPKGLLAHFKAIAQEVDLPIILYNVPGRTGSNVTADTTLKIAKEVPQLVGVKEASGNISQIADIIRNAPKNFSVLSGDDSLTYAVMALGGDGIISVASNEIPKEMSALTKAALDGNWEKAKRLHFEWLDLMNVNFIETNPQPVKTALFMMGLVKEVFRLPLVSMEDKNKEKLKEVLSSHKLL